MYKIILIFVTVFFLSITQAQDVYVSPTGSDDNDGSISSPFKSLHKAAAFVKGNAAGRTIWIKGGTYFTDVPVSLSSEHSGSEGSPLVIRAVPGETVIFTGGNSLPGEIFKKVEGEEFLSRIPQIAHEHVMVAELDESLADLFPSKDLYNKSASISWNGYIMQNAQFPNKGFAYFSSTIDAGPSTRFLPPGEAPAEYSEDNPTGGTFKMRESINWQMMSDEFKRTKDMLLDGYLNNDWFFQAERIGDIDAANEEIQLIRYTLYGIGGQIELPRRFYIKNALCQLDQPGEWYFDRLENKFYIWPIQPPNNQTPIMLLGSGRIIDANKAENVIIRDLTFQNFGVEGVKFASPRNVMVAGCKFRSSNGMGVRLQAALNSGIQSCDFSYLRQAFNIGGNTANRKTLTRENNYGRNNYIHHCTHRGYGLVAVSGMGSDFSNNLLHTLNGALGYAGNDILMEKNEFYNMGYEMGDWNAIYTNMDLSAQGNVVRKNFFHHLMETPGGYPVSCARTDDLGSGFHFDENIMYKTGRAGVQYTGPENSIKNNVLMETPMLWWTSQSPYEKTPESEWLLKTKVLQEKWDRYQELLREIADGEKSFNDKENKIGKAETIFGTKGWENNEIWKAHYPNLPNMFKFMEPDNNPWMTTHNEITGNYISGANNWPFHFHGHNSVVTYEKARLMLPQSTEFEMPAVFSPSEMFENPDELDFRFKESFTPAQGFEKWDFNEVGLYVDEFRRSMPDKKKYRMAIKEKYKNVRSNGGTLDLDLLNNRYSYPEYLSLVSNFAVVSEKPVLYWPLDEGLGKIANDFVGLNNAEWQESTDEEMPWMIGIAGGAIDLTAGVNDYLNANSDTLKNSVGISYSSWVLLKDEAVNGGVITNGEPGNEWALEISDNKAKAVFGGSKVIESTVLEKDVWHHILISWKNTGEVAMFVDGVLAAEATGGPLEYNTSDQWTIGKSVQNNTLNAAIDELAVFSNSVNEDEAEFIYKNGLHGLRIVDVFPERVTGMHIAPEEITLRKNYSLRLFPEISPSNATFQTVLWSSEDESIASVDDRGKVTAHADGVVRIIGETLNGGIKDTSVITVKSDMSGLFTEPIAYWPFDEFDGNIATDVIGGIKANWQNNGSDQEWLPGKFKRAATFNGGTEDRFKLESDPVEGSDAYSISAWFNLDVLGQYEGLVMTRNDSKGNNWGIAAEGNHIDARWNGVPFDSDNLISSRKWFHVVQTWQNNGMRSLYINGQLVKEDSNGATEYISNNTWYFGDDVCCNGREIDGRLDEVLMYGLVLSAEEIAKLYDMGKQGISYNDLFSVWPESVTVTPEDAALKNGESIQLAASILPVSTTNQYISWQSLDTKVASVDNSGKITAKGLGKTFVVATTEDSYKTDTCVVEVKPNLVSSITVSKDSVKLMENKYFQISATVLPEEATFKNYTWMSTNTDVVTVDDKGVLHSILEGEAYVIAISESGDFKDTCVVTVSAIHVESVELNETTVDVDKNEVFFILATVKPDNAKNRTLVWSSSNPAVVFSVGDGIFSALSKGTVTIKAVSEDGGIEALCTVNVDGGVGINDVYKEFGIRLYPNPAKESVLLHVPNFEDVKRADLCNALGQVVKSLNLSQDKAVIDLSHLKSGSYYLKMIVDNQIVTVPLVKVK